MCVCSSTRHREPLSKSYERKNIIKKSEKRRRKRSKWIETEPSKLSEREVIGRAPPILSGVCAIYTITTTTTPTQLTSISIKQQTQASLRELYHYYYSLYPRETSRTVGNALELRVRERALAIAENRFSFVAIADKSCSLVRWLLASSLFESVCSWTPNSTHRVCYLLFRSLFVCRTQCAIEYYFALSFVNDRSVFCLKQSIYDFCFVCKKKVCE